VVWVVLIVVAVALVAVVAALVVGRLPYDPMAEPVHSTPATGLPEEPTAADLDDVRFDTAARGYRMSEVDDALDALQTRLADQESELAELRARGPLPDIAEDARWRAPELPGTPKAPGALGDGPETEQRD